MVNGVYDYLVIGQGVAGSVLAMTLQEQGKTVYIVDSPSPNTSSRVAAGIMNPVTGKRMTLTWEADTFFPAAKAFYKRMESKAGKSFLFEHPIVRIFSSVSEQNDWSGKWSDEKYKNFITEGSMDSPMFKGISAPYGSMAVSGGGRVDTNALLDFVRSHFETLGQFAESEVKMDEIQASEGYNTWQHIKATHVVYCTGANSMEWDYLPYTPMKGEVLEVTSNELDQDHIFVGGCFLCPTQHSSYYAGATYDWRNTNLEKTEKAKEEIVDKVSKFTSPTLQIKEHRVGIRPAVKDRRPMLGLHPVKQNQYLFSGLGSKGVSMAPNLALQLYNFIEHGTPLGAEVDIKRFEA